MNSLTRWLGYAAYFIPSIPFGLQIYKSITFEHDSSLNVSQKITMELQPFFKKMGIRNDLIIYDAPPADVDCFVQSKGTNFANCHAAIYADPDLCNFERDGCNFFIKHEVAHIKYQDNFLTPYISLTVFFSSLTTAVILPYLPTLPTFTSPHLAPNTITLTISSVSIVTQAIMTQFSENQADDLAIAEGTIQELKGGRRILLALQSCFSDAFLPEIPLYHPTFDRRIHKIEVALKERHIQINESKEKMKINLLKNVLKPLINKKAFGFLDFGRREQINQAVQAMLAKRNKDIMKKFNKLEFDDKSLIKEANIQGTNLTAIIFTFLGNKTFY